MKPILQKVGLLIMLLLTSLVADANRTFEIDGLLYSVNSDPYLTGLGIVYLEPNPSREYSGDITVPDMAITIIKLLVLQMKHSSIAKI